MYSTTFFIGDRQRKQVAALGKIRGLKMGQIIRLALGEYLRRESKKQ